jgi:GAF domain-containing protein
VSEASPAPKAEDKPSEAAAAAAAEGQPSEPVAGTKAKPTAAESAPATAEEKPKDVVASQSASGSKAAEKPTSKRRIGEDLIGDLFESMHELHFMADVVAGAEFVLSVLETALPSELSVVHVFDINTGKFIIVRQRGGAERCLLHPTPDDDAFVKQVMRAPRATSVAEAASDDYFKSGRWQLLGRTVRHALSGPVRQGGRYLGLIELANPIGAQPYHESEANALDYICEQFAEFLANRPIVLDADVILKKR